MNPQSEHHRAHLFLRSVRPFADSVSPFMGAVLSHGHALSLVAAVSLVSLLLCGQAHADLFDEYTHTETFDLPAGPEAAERLTDVRPDGRVITLVGADFYVESAPGSRAFQSQGTLPGAPAVFFLSFLRVSPNQTKMAVGTFDQVAVCALTPLTCTWFNIDHFDGKWLDDRYMIVTQSFSGTAAVFDTQSADSTNPDKTVIIQGIPGSPAGAAIDAGGNLFVATYRFTDEGTPIYYFAQADWINAWRTSTPLDYTSDGLLIADFLDGVSGAGFGFDTEGNLFSGGSLDTAFTALIRAGAVADAVAGQGPVNTADLQQVRTFDPLICKSGDYYLPFFNNVRKELYIRSFPLTGCETTVEVYSSLQTDTGDPWADEVVQASASLDDSGDYDDPQSVLGEPSTTFYDPFTSSQFTVSLVVAPFYRDAPSGNKLITTLNSSEFIKVRFDEPVEDHDRNPFGIDLIIFGNSFFSPSGGTVGPNADMQSLHLSGLLFAEPVTVAVSPTGIGSPQTHPDEWYSFSQGPFADTLFPTNARAWDHDSSTWGDSLDFTLPVDPALELTDFSGISAADAIDLYGCSGGGTGFDLVESGFKSISYVYVSSNAGGEVDALSDVFPALGDFDRNGTVDLRDIAHFQNCFTGEFGQKPPCTCRSGNWDDLEGIDLADYAELVPFLEGPQGPQ